MPRVFVETNNKEEQCVGMVVVGRRETTALMGDPNLQLAILLTNMYISLRLASVCPMQFIRTLTTSSMSSSAASTSPISPYFAVNEGRTAGKWAARAAKHQYRQDAPRMALRLSGWLCLPVMLIFDTIICTAGYYLFLPFLSIRPRCKSYLAKFYSISHRMSCTGILLVEVIWHGAMARGEEE